MTDKMPTIAKKAVSEKPREPENPSVVTPIRRGPGRPRKNPIPALAAVRSGLTEVLADIAREVEAQDEKWGEQNHPLQGGLFPSGSRKHWNDQADGWKRINDQRVKDKALGWDGILVEEVFEALAETDVGAAVAELVQVAAVAVNAILSIQRNAFPPTQAEVA